METTTDMEFSVQDAGPCRKRVSVSIPPGLVADAFDKSYKNLIKTVPIPGFRQGRAPRKLVEKRFGSQVAGEVKQSLLDDAFAKALKQNDLSPIADPELKIDAIEVTPGEKLDFDFTITVKPEFELPDLKGIEVAVPSADPSKDELEAALLDLRKRKATLRPVEKGPIEHGDVVSLSVRGLDGEREVFHEESLNYEVGTSWLGGLVAEGLDDALLGGEAGATAESKAYAPPHEENHPLAGLELAISAEVLDFKRPDLPQLDDALAKSFDFDDKDELIAQVTKDLQRHKEREREKRIEHLALMELEHQCGFELPQDWIEKEADELARRAAYELQMQGKSDEAIATKVAEIKARRAEESARELRAFFILDKIVDKERILVTETEVKSAVALIAAHNDRTPEQMYATLRDAGRLGSLRNQLRESKAREKLRKKVKVTEAAAPKKKTES